MPSSSTIPTTGCATPGLALGFDILWARDQSTYGQSSPVMDVQMTEISRDRQPTLRIIVGDDKGRVGQWSGHREFSRSFSRERRL